MTAKPTAPALVPAPHELAHLAHTTTAGRLDETQLVRTLIGATQAGMPWGDLMSTVILLARTGGDAHDLRTQVDAWIRTHANAANAWKTNHPNGAR
jgi:hypothetical protein